MEPLSSTCKIPNLHELAEMMFNNRWKWRKHPPCYWDMDDEERECWVDDAKFLLEHITGWKE